MVVAAILGLALALPTGALFGVGYGTGVRIGYEQVYPLLFPVGKRGDATLTNSNIKSINQIYDAIGGKEASQMGIAQGILSQAVGELKTNPDFQVLGELESNASGVTSLNLTLQKILEVQDKQLSLDLRNSKKGAGGGPDADRDDENTPTTILDIPIISDETITPPTQGPIELSDPYTFKSKTYTELLNMQTAARLWSQAKRNNLYDWIKIKREANKSTVTTPEKFTPSKPFSAQSSAVKEYQIMRGVRIDEIGRARAGLRNADAIKSKSAAHMAAYKSNLAKVERIKQAFMRFVTLARNVTATKLQANRDWNSRIWNRY